MPSARPSSPDEARLGVVIRPETPDDGSAIRAIHDRAFREPDEGRIVDAVRDEPWFAAELSLVAVLDDEVVGHVLLSVCPVESRDRATVGGVLALGPISVDPAVQRQGIGGALVEAALAVARARGVAAVVLLGHPTYYPRFGFIPARSLGLEPPAPWPDADWMVRPLEPDLLPRGIVRYPTAFDPL